MDEAIIKILICPHCGIDLRENGGSLVCSNGHTSNIARQGYVSLLGKYAGTHTADSLAMVDARERVLGAGLFAPVEAAISEEVAKAGLAEVEGAIVDLGTGTGYYLSAALEAAPSRVGLGIDNSKFAARKAAKCHPRAAAAVADIWDGIPVRDRAAAIIINVFAPRNGAEIDRMLADGGRLIVVTPNANHLTELIEPFEMVGVDPDKESRLEKSLGEAGDDLGGRTVEWTMDLKPDEVRDLVAMGPSAGRLEADRLEELVSGLAERTAVTGSVRVSSPESAESVDPGSDDEDQADPDDQRDD